MGDREGGALPTAHPTGTSTGTAGSTASPGTRSQNSRCFASIGTVVLRDRPRIRVRLEYSREPTSVGACALCRGSQQVSAQQDRSAGPVSGLERVRERSALLADTVHSGRPLVSTSTRRHLFANLSMPVCAVKNSMRFKTQSILPYWSMVLVRTSHLTLHRTQPPSIASQTTVLSRGSSGGYSCCTPVLLISRLLKYRLHHSSVAVR